MSGSRLLIAIMAIWLCGCAYIPKERFGPLYSAEGVFLDNNRVILLLAGTRYQAVQMLVPAPIPALLDHSEVYAVSLTIGGDGGGFQVVEHVDHIDWPRTLWTIWNLSANYHTTQGSVALLAPNKKSKSSELDHVRAMTRDHSQALDVTHKSTVLFDTRDGTATDDPSTQHLCELFTVTNRELGDPGDWSLSDDLQYVLATPPAFRSDRGSSSSVGSPVPVSVNGMNLDLWRDAIVYDRARKRFIRIDSGGRFKRPCLIGISDGTPVILYGQPLGGVDEIDPEFVKSLGETEQWPLHFDHSRLAGGRIKEPLCAWDPAHHRVALLRGNDPYAGNYASERTPENLNGHYLVEVYDYVAQKTVLHREFDSNTIRDVIASLSAQPAHPQ